VARPCDVNASEAERIAAIQRRLAVAFAGGYKVLYDLDNSEDYKNFAWVKRFRGCAPLFSIKNDMDDREATAVGAIVRYTYIRDKEYWDSDESER